MSLPAHRKKIIFLRAGKSGVIRGAPSELFPWGVRERGNRESCAIFKPCRHGRVYRRMPRNSRDNGQKMEVRGKGVGGFSTADIERRAKELALIDNRTVANDADRDRARVEFRDRDLPDTVNEDSDTMQSMSRDPSDPMTDRGHQVPEYGGQDEDTDLQKMALEGVEEAQHDQMVESRNNVDEPLRSRPKKKQP